MMNDGHLTDVCASAARPISLPPRVQAYLDATIRTCAENEGLVSVILFGSAATGGFSGTVSDVDLILILPDCASQEKRGRLRDAVERLESLYCFCERPPRPHGMLEAFVERATANVHSFFICTRADLLSGRVARILSLRRTQAIFVDRVVIPSIVASAVTIWGEDLLAQVPMLPIRRLDVFKAFFGLFAQLLLSFAVFPVLPGATKYAMGTLKRSVHNCFFCYFGRPAALAEEVAFFQKRLGPSRCLDQLMALRGEYRRSFAFVARCLPVLAWLHLRTAIGNRFPREILVRPPNRS